MEMSCLLGSGEWETCCNAVGLYVYNWLKILSMIPEGVFKYAWVVDFPMFEMDEEDNLVARHHPFTHRNLRILIN